MQAVPHIPVADRWRRLATKGDTRCMTADWSIGEPDDHGRVLLAQRFDPSRLSLVARGHDQVSSWELHDGPHPRIEDPAAVGERLIIRNEHGGNFETGGVGPALSAGQTATVSTAGGGTGQRRREFLTARCAPQVSSADIVIDDGSHTHVHATTSVSTGQQWVVLAFEPHHRPTRISFNDAAGNHLEAQTVVSQLRHGPPRD